MLLLVISSLLVEHWVDSLFKDLLSRVYTLKAAFVEEVS